MNILMGNEKQIIEARRHPFYFYTNSFGLLLLAIIPLIIHRVSIEFIPLQHNIFVLSFFVFSYSLFLLMIWIAIFISWTDYHMDAWIITDSRVIDFELKGLFRRDIASVNLSEIQDVKVEINGIIEHLLKIGDIHLQTAGANKEFVIRGIVEPEMVKNKIFEAIEHHRTVHNSVVTSEDVSGIIKQD